MGGIGIGILLQGCLKETIDAGLRCQGVGQAGTQIDGMAAGGRIGVGAAVTLAVLEIELQQAAQCTGQDAIHAQIEIAPASRPIVVAGADRRLQLAAGKPAPSATGCVAEMVGTEDGICAARSRLSRAVQCRVVARRRHGFVNGAGRQLEAEADAALSDIERLLADLRS